MKRRDFFQSLLQPVKREEKFLPPPYFADLSDFEKCQSCEEKPCVSACEEAIIRIVDQKPQLDFSKSGCTYCDACALLCPKEVLKVESRKDIGKASINPVGCMAWHQTICSLCHDICETRAIKFYGMFKPEIDANLCNGCGFCIGVCPSGAIDIKGVA